jgi:hypothetical protein
MAGSTLTDLKRAFKAAAAAAAAAGVAPTRVEIKIVLIFGETEALEKISEPTALDQWRASRGAG